MMNILFINNFRGRGGGEEFLRDLLPGLVQKGVKVGLVCRPGTPLTEMFAGSSITVHPISRSGLGALTSVFKMGRVIRKEGYEVVNIQRGHDIIQSWIAARLSGKRPKLIYTVQVPEFIRSRFLLSRMDRIIAVSRYIKNKIVTYSRPLMDRISVINYGIDAEGFSQELVEKGFIRNRFGLSSDEKLIGTVGDLWKNQIEFLDALVEIRRTVPNVKFVLVASERGISQIDTFKQRVTELGLDGAVLWAGRLSKDTMRAFYADIDIAVTTHRNEGFGIWVLEALAMGKPVAAFNEGGVRDSLEGCPAGILVNDGASEMAVEIARILGDRSVKDEMSAAAPGWIQPRFTRKRMIDDHYQSCIEVARSRNG